VRHEKTARRRLCLLCAGYIQPLFDHLDSLGHSIKTQLLLSNARSQVPKVLQDSALCGFDVVQAMLHLAHVIADLVDLPAHAAQVFDDDVVYVVHRPQSTLLQTGAVGPLLCPWPASQPAAAGLPTILAPRFS